MLLFRLRLYYRNLSHYISPFQMQNWTSSSSLYCAPPIKTGLCWMGHIPIQQLTDRQYQKYITSVCYVFLAICNNRLHGILGADLLPSHTATRQCSVQSLIPEHPRVDDICAVQFFTAHLAGHGNSLHTWRIEFLFPALHFCRSWRYTARALAPGIYILPLGTAYGWIHYVRLLALL